MSTRSDILESITNWPLWLRLGWYDFIFRFRRSTIGPFWLTVQAAVWTLGIALIFGERLHGDDQSALPYIAAGIVVWYFISGTITEGAGLFVQNSALIGSVRIPLASLAFRRIVWGLLRFAMQLIVFVVIAVWVGIPPAWSMLLVLPGLVALIVTASWVTLLLGTLGARFHDLPYAIGTVMRFMFFASPVFWRPEHIGTRAFVAEVNPITHYLAVVRAPMIGEMPSALSWTVVGLMTVAGWAITLYVFERYRRSIVFWI